MNRGVIIAGGAVLLALAACSGGERPDAVEPTVEVALTTAVATDDAAATDAAIPQETATPAAVEEPARVMTPSEMERPFATPRPISVHHEQIATTLPPPPAPPAKPLSLEDLEARQLRGQILEARWRKKEGLGPWIPVGEALLNPKEGRHRVVGVERCLNVRGEPYIEAEVRACIPLGAHVEPLTGVGITVRDGITWLQVLYATVSDGARPTYIKGGFVSARYLEGAALSHVKGLPSHVAPEEFPDNVAVLVRPHVGGWIPSEMISLSFSQLDRIYRRSDGEVVRETVMTLEDLAAAHPDALKELLDGLSMEEAKPMRIIEVRGFAAIPDGSHIYASVCIGQQPSWDYYTGRGCYTLDREHGLFGGVGIFESRDGGVTWSYLGELDDVPKLPPRYDNWWTVIGALPGDQPQLVMWREGRHQETLSPAAEVVLFPSGKIRILDDRSRLDLPDRIGLELRRTIPPEFEATDPVEYPVLSASIAASLLFGDGLYDEELPDHLRWSIPSTPIPSHLYRHYLPGDDRPDDSYTYYYLEHFSRLALQPGPFLQVVDVGEDCLSLRAEPSLDAEELACMAERVLLQDQGDVVTDEGIIWRKAKTPAGVVGWADGRYLEG